MSLVYENGIASTTSGGDSFITNDIIITGAVTWVDSVNGNDSNAGSEESPLETLAQAITNATANNGDVIVIKSGHAETLAASQSFSKAGIKVYGLGSGTNRPSFTVNGNVDMFSLDAANVELNNLYFPAGTAAHTSRINIAAAGCVVKSCGFQCGANDLETITVEDAGDHSTISSCTFTVTADGPDAAIEIESATALGLQVTGCSFDGGSDGFDAGAINSAVAHTEFIYTNNTLSNFADIVHTAAATGWCSGTVAGDGCHVRI
jgi:hypothetical protein